MSEQRYHVGQELWRHDVNGDRRGGPIRVTVVKVGRKLVTTDGRHGRPETFRIDTGRTNDAYQHGWLCTDGDHEAHIARAKALKRLAALHVRFDSGGYERHHSTATLNAVADLLTNPPTPDGTPADVRAECEESAVAEETTDGAWRCRNCEAWSKSDRDQCYECGYMRTPPEQPTPSPPSGTESAEEAR